MQIIGQIRPMVRVFFFLLFSDDKTFSHLKRHENHKRSSTKTVFWCCITNCLILDGFLKAQSSKGQKSEQKISPHCTGSEPGVWWVMWLSRAQGLLQSPHLWQFEMYPYNPGSHLLADCWLEATPVSHAKQRSTPIFKARNRQSPHTGSLWCFKSSLPWSWPFLRTRITTQLSWGSSLHNK